MNLKSILAAKGGNVITIHPGATVAALVNLLRTHGIGAVVVSGDGSAIDGIVSERDVVRALCEGDDVLSQPVSAIMTSPVHTSPPDTSIDDLMRLMTEHRFRHVPISDDGRLVGIVSIGDAVKHRIEELEHERAALMDYVTRGG